MKTSIPLVLTARIADNDLEPFDRLRREHFPPERNFLRAHLTMFHRLPGEHGAQILGALAEVTNGAFPLKAEISGVRHLGAGVAYAITSPSLHNIRTELRSRFVTWLGSQDMRAWQPHITIQNKASKVQADGLYRQLGSSFMPQVISLEGLDLWDYRGGPWEHRAYVPFSTPPGRNSAH